MKNNNSITSFSIFSKLNKVIDEVGEGRLYSLIAHHEPDQFCKTIKISLFNKNIHLCTRCTGIYLGIILTILYFLLSFTFLNTFIFVIIYGFPIPAILDWGLEKYDFWKGNNATRFISGFMLGICYIFLLKRFLHDPSDIMVWSVAIIYVIIVCYILFTHKK